MDALAFLSRIGMDAHIAIHLATGGNCSLDSGDDLLHPETRGVNPVREHLTRSLLGHEGEVLRVYDDATGKTLNRGDTLQGFATIGVGRNLMGRGISAAESRLLLTNDLDAVESELDGQFPIWRTFGHGRQAAFMELSFNLGTANFLRGWPTLVSHAIAGRWGEVATVLLGSRWRKQVGETRAQSIVRLMLTGELT